MGALTTKKLGLLQENGFYESFEDYTRDPNNNVDIDTPKADPNFLNENRKSVVDRCRKFIIEKYAKTGLCCEPTPLYYLIDEGPGN